MFQRKLHVDFETYSGTDIGDCGSYKYCQDTDFNILLMAWSFDDEPEQIWDFFSGEPFPQEVADAFYDPTVEKMAHNAAFEMDCIEKYFGRKLDAMEWTCTMVKCAMLGLPMALDAVSSVLKLTDAKQKSGKALIKKFCVPTKPHKVDGRTRNFPEHYPEDWETFKEYCIFDVKAEKEICKKTDFYKIPPFERELWALDRKINQTGVPADRSFIQSAIFLVELNTEIMLREMKRITGIENPNSDAQIKTWLANEIGLPDDFDIVLRKNEISKEVLESEIPEVQKVLSIRGELKKTSNAKYYAMVDMMATDDRIRGLHQFIGAGRTWRWAGRKVQPQNLTKNTVEYFGDPEKDTDIMAFVRELVRARDVESLGFFYDNLPNVYSQLIRSAFVAPKGSRFIVSDFSSIEAVVIAWEASEQWRLDAFIEGKDIYKVSYAMMFGIPESEVTPAQRQQGKVAELACGYQGGVNALTAMDYKNAIADKEKPKIIKSWREASPNIKKLWKSSNDAAINCIKYKEKITIERGMEFFYAKNCLWVRLPAGRLLCYFGAHVAMGKIRYNEIRTVFNEELKEYEDKEVEVVKEIEQVFYYGMNQTTKQWQKMSLYGGKAVENMTQAIARDCLAEKMVQLDKAGYKIVMHVHDEVVLEMPYGKGSIEEVNEIMASPVHWAPDLPLKAKSFETEFYKKD